MCGPGSVDKSGACTVRESPSLQSDDRVLWSSFLNRPNQLSAPHALPKGEACGRHFPPFDLFSRTPHSAQSPWVAQGTLEPQSPTIHTLETVLSPPTLWYTVQVTDGQHHVLQGGKHTVLPLPEPRSFLATPTRPCPPPPPTGMGQLQGVWEMPCTHTKTPCGERSPQAVSTCR